jgi:hypothetical protein
MLPLVNLAELDGGVGNFSKPKFRMFPFCPIAFRDATELFLTVLPVCGCRNERKHPADAARQSATASGADVKLASQSSGAGGTVLKGKL